MVVYHTDSMGRNFRFELDGDSWKCTVDGDQFSINGSFKIVKDWSENLITGGKALYRIGAAEKIYTMTVMDEIELETDHLSFLEQTGRHVSRINKSKARLDWLMRMNTAGVELMEADWKQGAEVKS